VDPLFSPSPYSYRARRVLYRIPQQYGSPVPPYGPWPRRRGKGTETRPSIRIGISVDAGRKRRWAWPQQMTHGRPSINRAPCPNPFFPLFRPISLSGRVVL
jgi:hypothetical protein